MTVRDLMKMVCDHCFGDLKWCRSHTKEEFYLYHNTHKPIKGHRMWWTYLPLDPKQGEQYEN